VFLAVLALEAQKSNTRDQKASAMQSNTKSAIWYQVGKGGTKWASKVKVKGKQAMVCQENKAAPYDEKTCAVRRAHGPMCSSI